MLTSLDVSAMLTSLDVSAMLTSLDVSAILTSLDVYAMLTSLDVSAMLTSLDVLDLLHLIIQRLGFITYLLTFKMRDTSCDFLITCKCLPVTDLYHENNFISITGIIY